MKKIDERRKLRLRHLNIKITEVFVVALKDTRIWLPLRVWLKFILNPSLVVAAIKQQISPQNSNLLLQNTAKE